MLRVRLRWLLVLAGLCLAPSLARAQPDVPPVIFTGPLSHPRYDEPGLYTGMQFLYYWTNRPLGSQIVAVRGFYDLDGSITGKVGFFGSGAPALNTSDLMGPSTAQPGFDLFVGWRFQGGLCVELDWKHLVQGTYHATAGLIPPGFNTGAQFENTFLFSPVVNFSNLFAGPPQNIPTGNIGATLGIWNAASAMQINFTQRYDVYQVNVRAPIWETSDYRVYGLFGPRIAWIWDSFRWTTVAQDQNGNSGPQDTAIYSNTISNRLYGAHFGFGHDWYLGSTPVGAFALECELEGALYADFVKTSDNYTLGDNSVRSGRTLRKYAISPGVDARIGIKWYPWEAITIEVGYNINAFFNTVSSQQPIDFNLGQVDAAYNVQFLRTFQGLNFGITFVF